MLCNRKQLARLLNTTTNNIKMLDKRHTLEKRLYEYGYKLINKYKKGRKIVYEIELIENQNEIIKNNIYKYIFKVNDNDRFDAYFIYRTKNTDKPITLEDISNKCNVCTKTAHNWDNNLLDNKIMAKDGFFYMCKDNETGEIKQISLEEYKNYWRDRSYAKELDNIQERYLKGEIGLTEFQILSIEASNLRSVISKRCFFRISKFKLYEDNKLYQDIIKLIEQ